MEDEEHIDMEKLAQKARTANGNHEISQNDVMWYLVHRVDEISKRMGYTVTSNDCIGYRKRAKDRTAQCITWIIAVIAIAVSVMVFI